MGAEHIVGYRKDYYTDKVVPKWEMIGAWARSGLTDPQIAKNLGIGNTTFKRYLEEKEELRDYVRECREDAQIQVENALFKRATGYEYEEITKERKQDPETGKWKLVVTKKVLKQVVPDVAAAQYWLEHRAPNRWPKSPVQGVNVDQANATIVGLAALIANPVPVREIGSENQ